MTYVKITWIHDHIDEPVLLYAELDEALCELRKVDAYADGRHDFAGPMSRTGSTRLSCTPYPPLHEIDADPEFEVEIIDESAFNDVWCRATGQR